MKSKTGTSEFNDNKDESGLVNNKFNIAQRKFLLDVLDIGLNFFDDASRNGKHFHWESNTELLKKVAEPLPIKGMSRPDLLKSLRMIAKYSIPQHSNGFLAFPDAGNGEAALAADILIPFLNQNLVAVEKSAPIATFVEMQLLLWLRELVGYGRREMNESVTLDDIGGMWTSGGNMSNYIGLLAALTKTFPQARVEGIRSLDVNPVVVLSSGIDHFSLSSAIANLGLGAQKGILWCKPDSHFRTSYKAVQDHLQKARGKVKPFAVVAVAGNCRTTTIDDIKELHKLCVEYDVWLHVDACHGGSLLFSDSMKKEVENIRYADSISLDPHKGLFTPYASSYVLFKDSADLSRLSRFPDKTLAQGVHDLGLISPLFGSRRFESLKIWALWKSLGTSGIGRLVDRRQKVNFNLKSILSKTDLYSINSTGFYRNAFVFLPQHLRSSSEFKKGDASLIVDLVGTYTWKLAHDLYAHEGISFDKYEMLDIENAVGLGSNMRYRVLAVSAGSTHMSAQEYQNLKQILEKYCSALRANFIEDFQNIGKQGISESYLVHGGPAGW